MRLPLAMLLVVFLGACGGGGASREGAEPGASALDEAAMLEPEDRADTRRADHEAAAVAVPSASPTGPLFAFVRLGPGPAESGDGQEVTAPSRVGVDLDTHAFPPRALDPVLRVGALRFVHYGHPRPGVLRFTLAGEDLLPVGAEVSVQYGDDAQSRRVLVQSLSDEDRRAVAP